MRLFQKISTLHSFAYSTATVFPSKVIGFTRQLLLAYYFGLNRQLDIYYMANNAMLLVMSLFGFLFDQAIIPHLVNEKENSGEGSFKELTGSLLSFSIFFGSVLAISLFLFMKPFTAFIAPGFSGEEVGILQQYCRLFLPFLVMAFPILVINAVLKSLQYYQATLLSDLLTTSTTVLLLVALHASPRVLPVIQTVGSVVTLTFLSIFLTRVGMLSMGFQWKRLLPFCHTWAKLFLSNQTSAIAGWAEKIFQSYLPAGSISAYQMAQNIVQPVIDLLSFKEFYLVPLSSQRDRQQRFERLIIGLTLITVPVLFYLCTHSYGLITNLYARGRFQLEDILRMHSALPILALTIFSSTLGAPMQRLIQISGHLRWLVIRGLLMSVLLIGFYYVMIRKLQLGMEGLILSVVAVSYLQFFFYAAFFRRTDFHISYWRCFKYFAFTVACSVGVFYLESRIYSNRTSLIPFASGSVLYFSGIGLAYWPLRDRLQRLMKPGTA